MKSKQTKNVIDICCHNVQNGCREICPLADACIYIEGETKESFDKRMKAAAATMNIDFKIKSRFSFE